jgi:hypothetical protein
MPLFQFAVSADSAAQKSLESMALDANFAIGTAQTPINFQ